VYDNDTLLYATEAVRHHETDKHLLLWVNLLALRDVDHIRTSTSAPPNPRWLDRRSHPESLHGIVSRVTDVVAREFNNEGAARSIPHHAENDFSELLEYSMTSMERHMQRVQRFILFVLERYPDANVFHTASHSLALGEHGMRGGRTPMSTTCTTFVASRPATSKCQNLDAMLPNFILDSFQLSHPMELGQPVTCVPSLGLTRTLVRWNDHMYAVVECAGVIQNVFDLSTDPFELHDIVGNMAHIRHPIQLAIHSKSVINVKTTSSDEVIPQQQPNPVNTPSPVDSRSAVAMVSRRSRPTVASSSGSGSHSSSSVNLQNVRQAEQRRSNLRR
tara:strand:+ start:16342 stop:17337 length:996 start_codon:yes stop_codon:yes gene_type:complete